MGRNGGKSFVKLRQRKLHVMRQQQALWTDQGGHPCLVTLSWLLL
jgi:hypothetical protein